MNTVDQDIISRLIRLSHDLGNEQRGLAILGEGNTSADLGDGTFLVKASGSQLGTIDEKGITRVHMAPILAAIDEAEGMQDDEVRRRLENSRVDQRARLPSVETFLHALCLTEGGAKWIGHTHTISVLQILCSIHGAEPFLRHVFPDAIVVCGRHLAVVPYIDPGIHLAVAVRASLREFISIHGTTPKVILMENHGPVALGQTDREVLNIMLMMDKWAKVISGAISAGGARYLDAGIADRIDNRPDEHYRRQAIGNPDISSPAT